MADYAVIGAGLWGATIARMLSANGNSVVVLERKAHIGGMAYTETREGIIVHRYGAHLFHTNSREIWDFINLFGEWRQYEHRAKAMFCGRVYSFPVNRMTIQQINEIYPDSKNDILRRIVKMFYEGYTWKQWGEDVPDNVTARVPTRRTYDDRYFSDRYQGVPEHGYTAIIEAMLDSKNITTVLEVDGLTDIDYWRRNSKRVFYSGMLDELFGYESGALGYRSLRWEDEMMAGDFQGIGTMNYPAKDVPYTRIIEHKHLGWFGNPKTIISREYPEPYNGKNDPLYPVNVPANQAIAEIYRRKIAELPWLRVGGRLGSYQYLNMDQVIGQAMVLARKEMQ